MQANAFKRNAYRTVSAKKTKTAIRVQLARKAPVALAAQAILSLKSDTSHLLEALQPYLLGFQLNGDMLDNAKQVLGNITQHIAVLARVTRAKLPGSGKRVTLKGITITQSILDLDVEATSMAQHLQASFDGEEMDLELVRERVEQFTAVLYGVIFMLLKVTPGELMDFQQVTMEEKFGSGMFHPQTPEVIAAKAEEVSAAQ